MSSLNKTRRIREGLLAYFKRDKADLLAKTQREGDLQRPR